MLMPAEMHVRSPFGGLLLAVAPERASALEAELQSAGLPARIVGEILPKAEQEIIVKY